MLDQPLPLEEEPPWPFGEERRAAVRWPAALTATCRLASGRGGPWRARACDISILGISLLLDEALAPGALLEIDLEGRSRRTVQARVVHARTEEDGGCIIGCAFTRELGDEELRLFQAQRVRPRGPDNRRWTRFPCDVETVCYMAETAPGERRPARVVDISAGGIGLLLPCQFAVGTLLYFELPPVRGQRSNKALVRVVRAVERADGTWFLGCEFARQLSAEELRELL
jgi:hypothetical protein